MIAPFFTVVIPTYNRSALLKEAIQSVLDQTYQDFELIIVDDHSTDNTKEIVSSFNDNRIIYFLNNRTKGAAGARNAGIFKASSEWITFLDSDDIWLPKKLEVQFEHIQKMDENIGFIYAGYMVYDFENKVKVKSYLPEKEGWIQKDLLYTNCVTGLPSVAVRRHILMMVGGFDESLPALEDWELYVRIAGITKFVITKGVLFYVRKSNQDRLSFNYRQKLTAALIFRKKHYSLIRTSPRHCHRFATIILMWSLEISDWFNVLKAFPWTPVGIVFDPYNFAKTMRGIYFKLTNSSKLQH